MNYSQMCKKLFLIILDKFLTIRVLKGENHVPALAVFREMCIFASEKQ